MEKLAALVICWLAMVMPMGQCSIEGPEEVYNWFHKLPYAEEKVSKLHFYFHDALSGKNPTAVRVAQASGSAKSPTFFGVVFVIDDPLTEGPEATSKELGRAQGLYGSDGKEEVSLLMAMDFVFTSGKYNGSSLTVLGRNPVFHPLREMPIIGGTGVFRLARGIATVKTRSLNTTTGDAIAEYHVVVIHY
ncbi:Dirigent protein - like 7 [Theobroma cacao]|nr:Dirigent protein - like 7 [Theobroma cacao]